MVLFVLFFVIYGVLRRAVNFAAVFKDALDLPLAVMQCLQMEAVVVAGVQRIQNGGQTADGVIDRGQEFAVLSSVDTAFQILTAAHSKIGFHVFAQKRLIEQFVVPALDIFRRSIGDILFARLPLDLVTILLQKLNELLAVGTVLHGFFDGIAQTLFPFWDMKRVCLAFCDGETVFPAELVAELLGLLHLADGLMELLSCLEVY